MEIAIFFSISLLCAFSTWPSVVAEPFHDKVALLDFINNIRHSRPLNWNPFSPVCNNWIGVVCSDNNSSVIALRLPGVGLIGPIPPNTLSRITSLEKLSLRSNNISGTFPSDFSLLSSLTELHLQSNSLSGPLPTNFSVWRNLTVLNLSVNDFNGSIPSSISESSNLVVLKLSNNSLTGEIPDLQLPDLRFLDLTYNNLEGAIPQSLRKFPMSSFTGNSLIFPLSPSPLPSSPIPLPSSPSPLPFPSSKKPGTYLSEPVILGIIVGGCSLAFVMLGLLLFVFCFRTEEQRDLPSGKLPEKAIATREEQDNRVVFFEGITLAFDLEDLLRASAEVLGKGTFGTAYKANLEDSTTVVVKRLKEVGVGKREFEQQMELVGSIKHENVAELKAYYFSKDEKLIIYDYFSSGSLSSILHGERGEGRSQLEWETRIRAAVGAARGIAYIHLQNGGKMVHGNVKSSNIFFNSVGSGCVGDAGLAAVASSAVPRTTRNAGYRAPEIFDVRKSTQAADVYSFGVVLLELLTGKAAVSVTAGGGGRGGELVHLARWVNSVVREEWTAEVFDEELIKSGGNEEEMVELLQIALACVARSPEKRPRMPELVGLVEGVRRADG